MREIGKKHLFFSFFLQKKLHFFQKVFGLFKNALFLSGKSLTTNI